MSNTVMYPARYWIPHVSVVSRAALLFRPVLLVPHVPLVIWHIVRLAAGGLGAWVAGVTTGRSPIGLWRMNDRSMRYLVRLTAWCIVLTDMRPPWTGRVSHLHTIRVHHEHPSAVRRARVFFRLHLAQPYLLWALPYTIGFAAWHAVGLLVMLFTARRHAWIMSPAEEWLVSVARVAAWLVVLVDEYPPYNGVQPAEVDAWFHERHQVAER